MRPLSLALLLSAVVSPAFSQGWSGEISAGYLSTSGNTSTASGSLKLAADYAAERWKNSFTALAIHTRDQSDSTAERYALTDKVDWNFDPRNYAFLAADFEKDLFGGVRQRTSQAIGYGRHVLTGPEHLLDLEIGAGVRQTENQDGQRDDDAIGRAYGKYQWKLSPTSDFAQALKLEAGAANTYLESVTELKLSILGNLFASLSYTVKNNSDVPAENERTDTFSAVSLTYQFGKS